MGGRDGDGWGGGGGGRAGGGGSGGAGGVEGLTLTHSSFVPRVDLRN